MHRLRLHIILLLIAVAAASCSNAPKQLEPAPVDHAPEGTIAEPSIDASHEPDASNEREAPVNDSVEGDATEEEPMIDDPNRLSPGDLVILNALGWQEHAGDSLAAWVSVDQQRFYLIENGIITWQVPCATATKGTGSVSGSEMTPLGWHAVSEKFGDGAVWGQVFRARAQTSEVWKPGGDTEEDLVLTRILWLDGLEPGKNKGKDAQGVTVDSKSRYIYIHGTNGEDVIGTPSSHGCIRLRNDDVIAAFDQMPIGTPVLITENGAT